MFRIRNLPDVILRYSPDESQGGEGGNGGEQQQGGNQAQSQGNNSQQGQGQGSESGQSNQGLAGLLSRYNNDALKVAERLLKDNYDLREENRGLKQQTQDATVLRDADKSAWEAYKALGAPSDIATKLRQGELERVAGKAGYNAQVFTDLDRMAGGKLVYEVKSEAVDGKQVEQIYVKDGDAAPQLLNEYATAKWGAYLPALQPQQSSQGQGSGGASAGTRFPLQGTGNSGAQGATDLVAKFQQEQAERDKAVANPLLRK